MTKMGLTYTRNILVQTKEFEIVSCEWQKDSASALHNHDWSLCHVLVQEGVFENESHNGYRTEFSIYETGQVMSTPRGVEHRIKCLSAKGKTLHVYVPKLAESKTHLSPINIADIKKLVDLKVSNKGVKWNELSSELSKIREHSLSTNSVYFMNQLFSGVSAETIAADEVLTQTKTTMATFEASPVLSLVEVEVVKQLGEVIGWQQTEGITVPGGSSANFMALHCARQRRFENYKEEGLAGNKVKVFVSEEAHYSFRKACIVLGLGSNALVTIKADENGRLLMSDLSEKVSHAVQKGEVPLLVAATAGTTVFGAFDPVKEMAAFCKAQGIWLHVDGAWGGPVIFSKQHRHLIDGIQMADSFTFDAHKLFGANLTCSFFLTKHTTVLLEANDVSGGDYLFHESEMVDRGRLSWQCGRQAEAISFWTIWKSAGTSGLENFVDRMMKVREENAAWIQQQPRLKLLKNPDYLNICVQILPPRAGMDEAGWSLHVRNQLREKNLTMVNYSTTPDGTTFLRLILAHPKINSEIVQQIFQWALEVGLE